MKKAQNKNKSRETYLKILENTKRWRLTSKGVLTNMYHKMKSRRSVGFSLQDFHNRFMNDKKFNRLMKAWRKSGYDKQLKPSLDRIDCKKGYTVENTQMLTWAENRYKQSLEGKRGRKPAVLQLVAGKVIKRYSCQREAVIKTGISQGCMSMVLNGKRKTAGGYNFIYENPERLEDK